MVITVGYLGTTVAILGLQGTFIPNGVIAGKNEEKRTVDVGETSVSIGVITERAGIFGGDQVSADIYERYLAGTVD